MLDNKGLISLIFRHAEQNNDKEIKGHKEPIFFILIISALEREGVWVVGKSRLITEERCMEKLIISFCNFMLSFLHILNNLIFCFFYYICILKH